MSYIGTPPSNAFTSLLKQDFSTSATTGYTLDHAVNNANDIALFINFVRQEPTAGYAASGVTLTLTSATASSDDMYCVYLGQALQTVNPANGSVGTAQLIDGAVTKAKTSDLMYPAFEAYLSANQSISDNAVTKVQFNTELFDTDSTYDNSTNYRFTPGVAGKYFIYSSILNEAGSNSNLIEAYMYIKKNGANILELETSLNNNPGRLMPTFGMATLDLNDTDYVEIYGRLNSVSGSGQLFEGNTTYKRGTKFGAYRIGD